MENPPFTDDFPAINLDFERAVVDHLTTFP